MGVWDFLNNTVGTVGSVINSYNPFSIGLSLMRMVIGAIIILVIIIMLGVWLLRKPAAKEGARFRWY